MLATENGANLSGVPIELRDQNGKVLQTVMSSTGGAYSYTFSGLFAGPYFVAPALGRNQTAGPSQSLVTTLPKEVDFTIQGLLGTLTVSGCVPGTLVLITPPGIPAPSAPPTIGVGSNTTAYSIVAGSDGTATLNLPAQSSSATAYYLTTWKPVASGNAITYSRRPETGSTLLGGLVSPGATRTGDTCP